MAKKILLDIYTDMDWVMCLVQKAAASFDGNKNDQTLKTPQISKWEIDAAGQIILSKFHCSNLK